MRKFNIEHKAWDKPTIYVTLHQPPYKKENILNKTGWNQKDVNYYMTSQTEIDTTESFHYSYVNESKRLNKTFKLGGDYFISDKLINLSFQLNLFVDSSNIPFNMIKFLNASN